MFGWCVFICVGGETNHTESILNLKEVENDQMVFVICKLKLLTFFIRTRIVQKPNKNTNQPKNLFVCSNRFTRSHTHDFLFGKQKPGPEVD